MCYYYKVDYDYKFRFDDFIFNIKKGEFIDIEHNGILISKVGYENIETEQNYELLCHRMYIAYCFGLKPFGSVL